MLTVVIQVFDFNSDLQTKLGMFNNWLKIDSDNLDKYGEAYAIASDKSKVDILFLYLNLPKAVKSKIVDREQGNYYVGDLLLGGDLRTSARRINEDRQFEELKNQILELD